jgi:hemerythrin
MSVIRWKPVYETGIVELDNEHRELLVAINRLYEAIRDKRSEEVLNEVMSLLDDYTCHHFQHEERLMEEYHYPDLPKHREQHQNLIESLQTIKNEPVEIATMATNLFSFLRAWLLKHIVEEDKPYGPFLETSGGKFMS